jgi:hypothetical protein
MQAIFEAADGDGDGQLSVDATVEAVARITRQPKATVHRVAIPLLLHQLTASRDKGVRSNTRGDVRCSVGSGGGGDDATAGAGVGVGVHSKTSSTSSVLPGEFDGADGHGTASGAATVHMECFLELVQAVQRVSEAAHQVHAARKVLRRLPDNTVTECLGSLRGSSLFTKSVVRACCVLLMQRDVSWRDAVTFVALATPTGFVADVCDVQPESVGHAVLRVLAKFVSRMQATAQLLQQQNAVLVALWEWVQAMYLFAQVRIVAERVPAPLSRASSVSDGVTMKRYSSAVLVPAGGVSASAGGSAVPSRDVSAERRTRAAGVFSSAVRGSAAPHGDASVSGDRGHGGAIGGGRASHDENQHGERNDDDADGAGRTARLTSTTATSGLLAVSASPVTIGDTVVGAAWMRGDSGGAAASGGSPNVGDAAARPFIGGVDDSDGPSDGPGDSSGGGDVSRRRLQAAVAAVREAANARLTRGCSSATPSRGSLRL